MSLSQRGVSRWARHPEIQRQLDLGLLGGSSCVLAAGSLTPQGYGRATHNGSTMLAHRAVWLLSGRAIPAGMTLDHTCHDPSICVGGRTCAHRACVNLDHLRLASRAAQQRNSVNVNRKMCRNGLHPWVDWYETTRADGRVVRQCRECLRSSRRRYRQSLRSSTVEV